MQTQHIKKRMKFLLCREYVLLLPTEVGKKFVGQRTKTVDAIPSKLPAAELSPLSQYISRLDVSVTFSGLQTAHTDDTRRRELSIHNELFFLQIPVF